jgi:hypothetical protein
MNPLTNIQIFTHGWGRKMSLGFALKHDNVIYFAADTRSSFVDEEGRQLNYFDAYHKIIPSKTQKFMLLSTGCNSFTTDNKNIEAIVHDVDLWLEINPNRSIQEIFEYVDTMIQRYNYENLQMQVNNRHIQNDKQALDKLRGQLATTLTIGGFDNNKPVVYFKGSEPLEDGSFTDWNEGFVSVAYNKGFFLGVEDIVQALDKRTENVNWTDEESIIARINEIFEWSKNQSSFIGGNTEIFKMAFVNGKTTITRVL